MGYDLVSLIKEEENKRHKVLVIEDEPAIQSFYKDVLTANGCEVLIIDRGDRIYDIEDPGFIDIILQDLDLPGSLAGKELFYENYKQFFDSQIIIATGMNTAGQAIDYRQEGAEFMQKPMAIEELKEKINNALKTKHNIRKDIKTKIDELSKKYHKEKETRYVLALEEDKIITEKLAGNVHIKIFKDLHSIEQYVESLEPKSEQANVVLITNTGRDITKIAQKHKDSLEVPVIGVETENYNSARISDLLTKGFFDVVTEAKINISVEYAFLAHKEKYMKGTQGKSSSLKEARRSIEKPTIMICSPDKRARSNLDQYMTSAGLNIKIVEPADYKQIFEDINPDILMLDPIYLVESCIEKYDKSENNNISSLLKVIPREKRQQAIDSISKKDDGKKISAAEVLESIGENIESLTGRLVEKINTETKIRNSMFFVLEPAAKEYSGFVAHVAVNNRIGYLPSSLRPHETTRRLLTNLLSERQKNTIAQSDGKPANVIYAIIGHTCSGKNVTAKELETILGNSTEMIGNIKGIRSTDKPKEKRPGEENYSKDVYLKKELIDHIKEGHIGYAIRNLGMDDDVITSLTVNPYSYNHYGNEYYLQHIKIAKALRQGKNVILLTNGEGLEAIKKMKKNEELKNRIITINLYASPGSTKERNRERLEDGRIDIIEYNIRMKFLEHENEKIDQYKKEMTRLEREKSTDKIETDKEGAGLEKVIEKYRDVISLNSDMVFETDSISDRTGGVQERVNTILAEKEKVLSIGTIEERQSYISSLFNKLTRLEIEDFRDDRIYLQNLGASNHEIITVSQNSGICTVYLDGKKETQEERKIFLMYLTRLLGEPVQKRENPSYYNTSQMGNSELTYKYDNSVLKVSDVALYKIKPNEREQIRGNIPYTHSLAIVMVEDYNPNKGGINIKKS